MKKTYLLLAGMAMAAITYGQSQPNNLNIGLFDAGAHGSSSGNLEFALRPVSGTYTAVPAAEDFILYLVAPKTGFSLSDVVNISQTNTAIYGGTGTMLSQGVVDIGDPTYYYLPIVLSAPSGMNLSPLTVGNWSFAFTISFTPAKTPAQYRGIRIIDQTNNAFLSGVIGSPTFSTLPIGGSNQLTNAAFTVLPVNLLNFSGYKSGTKNVLKWTTANEQNSQGFEVQRSMDGVNYSVIGFVNSQAPGGNSSTDISYSYDDVTPLSSKKSYYRLKQVDLDNRSRLSNIVVINGDKPKIAGISGIYPNPASQLVNVIVDAAQREDVTLVVLDVNGKTVKQKIVNVETGSNTVPVEIGELASGSYLVKLISRSAEGESATSKFVKH